jgi:hypothetical protein
MNSNSTIQLTQAWRIKYTARFDLIKRSLVSHGFSITYRDLTGVIPPDDVDVILVAPKGSGTSVRRNFLSGAGINSSFAVAQDFTGRARDRALAVGIGVLPLVIGRHNIVYAFTHGLPATIPISEILKNPTFSLFATIFAIVAICTSYIANGMGLMDFNRDLLVHSAGKSGKVLLASLTFLPPQLIAVLFPHVFLKMIGIVGGIGIAVLFGVLPSIVYFKKTRLTRKKVLALTMLILFAAALCCDLLNDVGIINTSRETATLETKVPQRQK